MVVRETQGAAACCVLPTCTSKEVLVFSTPRFGSCESCVGSGPVCRGIGWRSWGIACRGVVGAGERSKFYGFGARRHKFSRSNSPTTPLVAGKLPGFWGGNSERRRAFFPLRRRLLRYGAACAAPPLASLCAATVVPLKRRLFTDYYAREYGQKDCDETSGTNMVAEDDNVSPLPGFAALGWPAGLPGEGARCART